MQALETVKLFKDKIQSEEERPSLKAFLDYSFPEYHDGKYDRELVKLHSQAAKFDFMERRAEGRFNLIVSDNEVHEGASVLVDYSLLKDLCGDNVELFMFREGEAQGTPVPLVLVDVGGVQHVQLTVESFSSVVFSNSVYESNTYAELTTTDKCIAFKFYPGAVTTSFGVKFFGGQIASPNGGIHLSLCADSNDEIGAELTTANIALGDIPGTMSWFPTVPAGITWELADATPYWIVISTTATNGPTGRHRLYYGTNRVASAYTKYKVTSTYTKQGSPVLRIFDSAGTEVKTYPYVSVVESYITSSNPITQYYTPAQNETINNIALYRSKRYSGAPTETIKFYDSVGDVLLGTATVIETGQVGWFYTQFDTTLNLISGHSYYFKVECATGSNLLSEYCITTNPAAASPGGVTDYMKIGSTSYTDRDLLFKLAYLPTRRRENLAPGAGGSGINGEKIYGVTQVANKIISMVDGVLTLLVVNLAKIGTPADLFYIDIQTDSAGSPSGTILETKTISGSDITTDAAWYELSGWAYSLTASQTYWIVFRSPSSASGSHCFSISINFCTTGNWSKYSLNGGSTWNNAVHNYSIKVANINIPKADLYDAGTYLTNVKRCAQSDTTGAVSEEIRAIGLVLIKGVPSETPTVTVDLCADNAGKPGSVLATGTLDYTVITTVGQYIIDFSSPYIMPPNTKHWYVVYTDGPRVNVAMTEYYDVNDSYGGSTEKALKSTDSGATWSDA